MRSLGHRVYILSSVYPTGFQEEDFWPVVVSRSLMHRTLVKIGLRPADDDPFEQTARAIADTIERIGDVDIYEIEETFGLCGRVNAALGRQGICRLHGPRSQIFKYAGLNPETGPDASAVADETKWIRNCGYVTAPTQFVLDETLEFSQHTPIKKASIYNPTVEHGAVVDRTGSVHNKVLFVGRVDYLKGADIALKAFGLVADSFPDARLTVVGPDVGVELGGRILQFSDLVDCFVPRGARARIEYKGRLTPSEVTELRRHHGITLVASRYETQANVLCEAMMAESATICVNLPYTEEFSQSDHNALAFEPGNAEAAAGCLETLLLNPEMQADMGRRGRLFLSENLDPKMIAEISVAFYREVMADAMERSEGMTQ